MFRGAQYVFSMKKRFERRYPMGIRGQNRTEIFGDRLSMLPSFRGRRFASQPIAYNEPNSIAAKSSQMKEPAVAGVIDEKLKELGIELPTAPSPVAAYVGWVRTGNLAVVSGQLPMLEGKMIYSGRVGDSCSEDDGVEAAKICAINCLAQLKNALGGDLDRVRQFVRLEGYVQCEAGFHNQPKIVNGASNLIVSVFGDKGRHSRVSLGMHELPLDAAVEIAIWVEVE